MIQLKVYSVIILWSLLLTNFIYGQDNSDKDSSTVINIALTQGKYRFSDFFKILNNIAPLKNDDAIAFNTGEAQLHLIYKYQELNKPKIIFGEDYLGYNEDYYKLFLSPLPKLWMDSTFRAVSINPVKSQVRIKFRVLESLIIDSYSTDDSLHYVIDSLFNTSFRYSTESLIKTSDFFISEFNKEKVCQAIFGSNINVAKEIIKDIEMQLSYLGKEESASKVICTENLKELTKYNDIYFLYDEEVHLPKELSIRLYIFQNRFSKRKLRKILNKIDKNVVETIIVK